MAIPTSIRTLEQQKFVDDGAGNVAVRTALVAKDIEIGAVELKDATTDVRQNVTLDSAQNAAFVQSESLASEATVTSIKDTDGIKKITDALPAGTNAIGKLAPNSGVDIGDVDVTSTVEPCLEIARGNTSGMSSVNKFGSAPSGVQVTATDIWSRADASPTQQVWLAPTAANRHTIASTSAADDTGSTGVNTVIVSYLADWDTAEQTETVVGDLNAGIQMTASAVMIHRMKVVPQSTTTNVGGNVGTITATAVAPSATTVTAVILPGDGQTEMAIYGVPSTQKAYLKRWGVSIDKTQGTAATCDFRVRLNPNPDVQTVAYLRKQDISLQSTGTNAAEKKYDVPPCYAGPCIIKVEAIASVADLDGQSDFDLILVDN